jgi:hypothetical protein
VGAVFVVVSMPVTVMGQQVCVDLRDEFEASSSVVAYKESEKNYRYLLGEIAKKKPDPELLALYNFFVDSPEGSPNSPLGRWYIEAIAARTRELGNTTETHQQLLEVANMALKGKYESYMQDFSWFERMAKVYYKCEWPPALTLPIPKE